MLIAKLIWGLEASIIDVEIIFLYGESTEEIHVNIPGGMKVDQDHCLQLKTKIYRLVQIAREFYQKLILVLKSIGYLENKSDPYFVLSWNSKKSNSH
jgi:hypothetical protein